MAIVENNQRDGVVKVFSKDVRTGEILGLPPSYIYEAAGGKGHDYIVLSGTPVMSIQPALPMPAKQQEGGTLQLFDMDFTKGWDRYNQILGTVYKNAPKDTYKGLRSLLESKSSNILVAFQNDASISESFVAEYSESRLEGGLSGISNDVLAEMRYITGSSGTDEALSKLGPDWKDVEGVKSFLGFAASGIAGGAAKGAGVAAEWATGGAGITKLAGGSKIDFPQIWRGCGYSPSYSFTVRLYNPYPKSLDAHRTFIIEPLAKLIALIVPVSDHPTTFSYPLICAASCPGLFCIESGYISALDIIKGGDTNAISYNQRPVMVDIKMTIASLYNTMIAHGFDDEGKSINIADKKRPTFKNYIQQLETEAGIPSKERYKNIWELTEEREKELGVYTTPVVGTTEEASTLTRVSTASQNTFTNLTS